MGGLIGIATQRFTRSVIECYEQNAWVHFHRRSIDR